MTVSAALLVAALAAPVSPPVGTASAPAQDALSKVLAAWGPAIVDVRARERLSEQDRRTLEGLVAEYADAGYELKVVLVDIGGPNFSLGELTTRIRAARDCTPGCLYLTAHRRTLHSSSRWYSYREARALAVALHSDYLAAPVPTLVRYGRQLMEEGRRRTRHRRLMLAVAAAALCGLAGVLARARRRQINADAT